MSISQTTAKLQQALDKLIDNKKIFGATISLEKGDGLFAFNGGAGELTPDTQYFVASTTKIYITAILLKLKELGKLNLSDKISNYLSTELMTDLHIHKGINYSNEITISHLMAHTSGLPDYFQQKKENGISLEFELTSGQDQSWSCESSVAESKKMKPTFYPGQKGKALYSDTNYQLLGKIIENITRKPVSQVMDELIFKPLNLTKTYLYTDSKDTRPAKLYFKEQQLLIPMAMVSFGPDGGIVSTAKESMLFIKAFFNGLLFPREYLSELQVWNNIFFPFQSGVGITKFQLPRIFSPFKPLPQFIGHSGLSGAFAFYCPDKDLYLTGTVNQISSPDSSFRLMMQLISYF